VYFPEISYSYHTCGASNTFDAWFAGSGSSSSTHKLTELTGVVKGYLTSVLSTVEDNQAELTGSSSCSFPDTSCNCGDCFREAAWSDTTASPPVEQKLSFAHATLTATPRADRNPAPMDRCLGQVVGSSFLKVASKEANTTRVGYQYSALQDYGTYMQWPGKQWCPGVASESAYDPRFRPWYAAAASGPKDVVIVIDTNPCPSMPFHALPCPSKPFHVPSAGDRHRHERLDAVGRAHPSLPQPSTGIRSLPRASMACHGLPRQARRRANRWR
jgi:hypothetical protein